MDAPADSADVRRRNLALVLRYLDAHGPCARTELAAGTGLVHATVTTLVALYRTEQLGYHLKLALENGLSQQELAEAITHLAFYAGWPNAMTAITQLKAVVEESAGSNA